MLFAQQVGSGSGLLLSLVVPLLAAAVVWNAVGYFFLRNLSESLREVSPGNRMMQPARVWLNLVPLFNVFWLFVTVTRVAESLRGEYDHRRLRDDGDFGRLLGFGTAGFAPLAAVPFVGPLFGLAALACGVAYWLKIAAHKRALREEFARRDRYDGRTRLRGSRFPRPNSYDDSDAFGEPSRRR